VDFVEICNFCARKAVIEAAKRIINYYKVCRSYSDLNFGVTFLEHSVFCLLLLLVCTSKPLSELLIKTAVCLVSVNDDITFTELYRSGLLVRHLSSTALPCVTCLTTCVKP